MKEIDIIQSLFYEIKFEINDKRKYGKIANMCKLSNVLLKNQRVNEEIRREIKNFGMNETRTQDTKTYEMQLRQF